MVALRLYPCLRFLGLVLLGSNLAPVLRLDWPQLHRDIRAHASTLFDALFKPSYTPLGSFDDSIETSDDPFSSFPAAPVPRAEVGRCFNLTSPALNHHQVLDLPIEAPQELIKPAYKKLVRVCHPDKLKEAVVSSEAASENYARLRLAYDVLKSQLSRCTYDYNMIFPRGLQRTKDQRLRCGDSAKLRLFCDGRKGEGDG